MTNPEFDQTSAPKEGNWYRVQRTDCNWSEWRSLDTPITEEYILSFQLSEKVTNEQYEEFVKQIKNDNNPIK